MSARSPGGLGVHGRRSPGVAQERVDPHRWALIRVDPSAVARRAASKPAECCQARPERPVAEDIDDRLAGKIRWPDGIPVADSDVRFIVRGHGRRADRRWGQGVGAGAGRAARWHPVRDHSQSDAARDSQPNDPCSNPGRFAPPLRAVVRLA